VRQWDIEKDGVQIPMSDIATDTKDAQLDHRSTFLGLDSNRLCRWDQRTVEGVVQDLSLSYKAGKDYSRGTNFTCLATSGDGYVAVGSRDGKIRLYGSRKGMENYEFKQAATSVPGLGLPITAIDVSYDSRYIVATTDKYLVVLQTFFQDAKGAETNGFVSRMGAKTRPPKLLKLKPEDRMKVVRARGGQQSFILSSVANALQGFVCWRALRPLHSCICTAAYPHTRWQTVVADAELALAGHDLEAREGEADVDHAERHDRALDFSGLRQVHNPVELQAREDAAAEHHLAGRVHRVRPLHDDCQTGQGR
jgi:VID27 C-terminal WD40-like domain